MFLYHFDSKAKIFAEKIFTVTIFLRDQLISVAA